MTSNHQKPDMESCNQDKQSDSRCQERPVPDTSYILGSHDNPTEPQIEPAFCYVAKEEDMLILDREKVVVSRLISGIIIWAVSVVGFGVGKDIPLATTMLLAVALLWQQWTIFLVWSLIQKSWNPHVWIRGYSWKK